MYYTYILYSPSENIFYKGSTKDLNDRVFRHTVGREKFTRTVKDWRLLWSTQKATKSEAYKLEMKLKNLSQQRTLKFMLKYRDGVAGPDELLIIEQLSGC